MVQKGCLENSKMVKNYSSLSDAWEKEKEKDFTSTDFTQKHGFEQLPCTCTQAETA